MIDVTVMGGGVFGLATAWACIRRGARVRLIERRGFGTGSSGGLVGALSPHVPENWNPKKQFQLESLLMAAGFWREVESVSGVSSGYLRCGRLQAIATDRALELARARAATAAELWRGEADWQILPEAECGGWQPLSPSGYLIRDTLSARAQPRRAGASLVAAIRARGADIVTGEGEAKGRVLWATGHEGLAELSAALGATVGGGVKGQSMALRHDAGAQAPQLYVDGLHIVPHGDGTVAIGSTTEREFDCPNGTDAQLDELHERAVLACPVLHGAPVVTRWAAVRPRAKSRAPMLGEWPGRPGHFVANGGFKIGFGMAPKVAEVMADLMLEGCDAIPEGFRVEDNL